MSQERLLVEGYSTRVRVDREAGMIYDALLLGPESRNGVVYPDQTREEAVPLFESARAFLSHEGERSLQAVKRPRRFEEQIGRYKDVRNTPDGLRGNIKVRKSHPYANLLFEAAEEEADDFGLSPVMVGLTRPDGKGKEVCHKIKHVKSVDVVTDPATTRGLFEQEEPQGEAEEGPSAAEMYEQACLKVIVEAAQKALKGESTPEEAAKSIKDALKQHLKVYGKDEAEGAEEEGQESQQAMEEELRVLRVEKECRVLCEQHEVSPDRELLDLLTDLPDREARTKHLNYLKRGSLVRKTKSGFKVEQKPEPEKRDLLQVLRS